MDLTEITFGQNTTDAFKRSPAFHFRIHRHHPHQVTLGLEIKYPRKQDPYIPVTDHDKYSAWVHTLNITGIHTCFNRNTRLSVESTRLMGNTYLETTLVEEIQQIGPVLYLQFTVDIMAVYLDRFKG